MDLKVLLCDDAQPYRTLLRAVLEGAGLRVVGEAVDGQDCLDRAEAADPDVVLLDVNMPRLGGCEALPGLRERIPHASILMLSTSPAIDQEQECLRMGARAYIEKPRDIFELPGMIRAALA